MFPTSKEERKKYYWAIYPKPRLVDKTNIPVIPFIVWGAGRLTNIIPKEEDTNLAGADMIKDNNKKS